MIRYEHCPHCSALNEIEGITKGIREISKGTARGGKKFDCRECGWKFSVIEAYESKSEYSLFQIDSDFRIDPSEDLFIAIPFEHTQDMEFEYDLIVREGSEIEILFLEEEEMEPLEKGNRFRVFSDLCKQDVVQDNDSGVLPAGRHRMVLREANEENEQIIVHCKIAAFGL